MAKDLLTSISGNAMFFAQEFLSSPRRKRDRIMMIRVSTVIIAAIALAMTAIGSGRAEIPAGAVKFQRTEYTVNADQSYTEVQTWEARVDWVGRIAEFSTDTFDFDPSDETLDVVEAWVQQPDGTRVAVPPGNIFTRPSAAAQTMPGFVGTRTTTIEFPGLQVGSVVHSKWKHTATRPDVMGFSVAKVLGLIDHARFEIRIQAPADLPLQFRERGGFVTSDTTSDQIRTITASIDVGATPPAEPQMIAAADIGPAFVATTLKNYEQIGAIYAARNAGKAAVTPEIAALARSIAGDAQGVDAARAVYDWVAGHIRYVAVFLDPSDGMVAHDAASVLRNGYGDCKDHVVLMQALLSALNIRAEPVLVNWTTSMRPLPLWTARWFTHAMIYLPDYDIYANPTNPYAGFGVLDNTLSGKLVVIASEKGEVGHTPRIAPATNGYRADVAIDVAPDGTIRGKAGIAIAPGIDPLVRQILVASTPAQVANRQLAATAEGGFGSLRATDPRDLSRPLRIDARWTSPHGVVVSAPSTYMTLPIGVDLAPNANLRGYIAADGMRRFPFLVEAHDYTVTYHVSLPPGAMVERLPPAVDIVNAAGRFTARYEPTGDGFTATRTTVLNGNVYQPAMYPDLERLIYAFGDDQRAVIVYRPKA